MSQLKIFSSIEGTTSWGWRRHCMERHTVAQAVVTAWDEERLLERNKRARSLVSLLTTCGNFSSRWPSARSQDHPPSSKVGGRMCFNIPVHSVFLQICFLRMKSLVPPFCGFRTKPIPSLSLGYLGSTSCFSSLGVWFTLEDEEENEGWVDQLGKCVHSPIKTQDPCCPKDGSPEVETLSGLAISRALWWKTQAEG